MGGYRRTSVLLCALLKNIDAILLIDRSPL